MNVLLIGSSFSAVPFLFDLKRRGHRVTVIGNNATDPCHAYADHSIFEDYSDADVLLKVCEQHKFDCTVPSCNDYSYVAGASVASKLGLPGFDSLDVTAILHTKDRFRQFCLEQGVPAPRIYGEVSDAEAGSRADLAIDGPALVKPVDSFSGRGVQLVMDAAQLPQAIDRAMEMSRGKRAVIEQYVDGALHSHTAFIADGRIIWHDFVDEFCEVYRYQVDRSAYPSILSRSIREAVQHSMERMVTALGLCDGLLHTQFIASASEYWIIECMRRCPGDLYGHHFKFSFGYNYESQYVAGFVGEQPKPPADADPNARLIERRVLSAAEPGAFFAVEACAEGMQTIYIPLKDSGLKLEAAPFDKAGILFLTASQDMSRAQMFDAASRMIFHA